MRSKMYEARSACSTAPLHSLVCPATYKFQRRSNHEANTSLTARRLDWALRLRQCSTAAAPAARSTHRSSEPVLSQHRRTLPAARRTCPTAPNAALHRPYTSPWLPTTRVAVTAAAASTAAASSTAAAPAAEQSAAIAVGDVLELRCERLGFGGKGICLAPPSGLVVMVERALPGELMHVQITAVKKGYAEAIKLASLAPHANAVEPACPHFGTCGGCTLQNLDYSAQLVHKAAHVQQLLARVGRVPAEQLRSICREPVGAPATQLYSYRNKTQFTFGAAKWVPRELLEVVAAPALGFLMPGSNSVVLPITECHLQHPIANGILSLVREEYQRLGLAPFDAANGTGVMRHLIIRSAGAHEDAHQKENSSSGSSNHVTSTSGNDSTSSSSGSSSMAGAITSYSNGSNKGPSAAAPDFMVVLVTTAAAERAPLHALAQTLVAQYPQVASVVWSIEADTQGSSGSSSGGGGNTSRAASRQNSSGTKQRSRAASSGSRGARASRGSRDSRDSSSSSSSSSSGSRHGSRALQSARSEVLYGKQQLVERLCGLDFAISPHSFFQTNSRQAEVLYRLVADAAELAPGGTDVLLDLYCGTGTIGLSMAHKCACVVGVDVTPSSIADAWANAAANGISNATFQCADLDALCAEGGLEAVMRGANSSGSNGNGSDQNHAGRVDVAIADPARAGMGPAVVAFLRGCGARRLVYVSCNAATLARDVERLCSSVGAAALGKGALLSGDRPFQLVSVTPVDLFPHTDHIEVVAVLDRPGGVTL